MHFGFSYIGLLYLVMLAVPNILWTKHKPAGYDSYAANENRVLTTFERVGQALVSTAALIFSDFNLRPWTPWSLWLVASFVLMLLYELSWARYFRSEQTMRDFYGSLLCIPVPIATLPVAAFLLLGIYGCNIVMIVSSVILGIGHVGIHLAYRTEVLGAPEKKPLVVRIVRLVLAATFAVVLAAISLVIGVRNVRYISHNDYFAKGVDEGIYLPLCGQEQYVLLMGKDVSNPVIVYLHGGPSSPDSFVTYSFADYLTDAYTFVCWDQRGCGRTYFRNEGSDPTNQTATFEQAEADLDALVEYARQRFGQEQVIIMGHSYGTVLGSQYALHHPDKVAAYVGVAQVTSLVTTDLYSYEDALSRATEAGDDTSQLEAALAAYRADESLENLLALRSVVSAYHPVRIADNETWCAVTSPYFGTDDFRWFLKQLGSMDAYFALNRQLFDYTFSFDAYSQGSSFEMPVYLISGTDDWVCPVDSVRDYLDTIDAPSKDLFLLDGCGHNAQYALPEEFARTVRDSLAQNVS